MENKNVTQPMDTRKNLCPPTDNNNKFRIHLHSFRRFIQILNTNLFVRSQTHKTLRSYGETSANCGA